MSRAGKIKLVKRALGQSYTRGEEHLFHCPRCEHHKKKLSINFEKNVFKCWVCDWSGKNIYRIIRQYGSTSDRYEWRSFEDRVEVENFADKLFAREDKSSTQKIELPDGFISLANKNLPVTSIYPLNYLKARGIGKKDIIKWKIGYCTTGAHASRVIVPSFGESGDINYFVSRAYDNDWKKYLNPNVSKDIIFNHPYIDFDEDLVLVEGVFDAIKAGDNSVPLLGSTLNENSLLFHNIVKNDTPIYLALDPDAEKKTNNLVDLFLKYDIETHLIDVNPFDDVGEMTSNEFVSRKQSAVLLNSSNYLISRIARI